MTRAEPGAGMPIADAWRTYDAIEARLTAGVSERMLDLAALCPGMRVLDLASGRGEPAVRAAHRVAPGGSVLGIDLEGSLLAIARERADSEGVTNLELLAMNAEALDRDVIADGAFDVVTARWALLGMKEPVAALLGARRALVPGGVLVAALWAEGERVPWWWLPRQVLARYRPLPALRRGAPGAVRYGDPARIMADWSGAGLVIEHVEEIDVAVIEVPDGAGFVAWVQDLGIAPLARELGVEEHAAWEADLAEAAERHRVGDVVRLGGVTRLVVARI